jgi:hypothetical protein
MKINIWIVLQIIWITLVAWGVIHTSQYPTYLPSDPIYFTIPYCLYVLIFGSVLVSISFFFGWMAHRHQMKGNSK